MSRRTAPHTASHAPRTLLPRRALLVDLHWLDLHWQDLVRLRPPGATAPTTAPTEAAAEAAAAASPEFVTGLVTGVGEWPNLPVPGSPPYTHRLVAASASLICQYVTQLADCPLALARTPRAAQTVLLDRARTLIEHGYRTATVLADPRFAAAIANLGLRPPHRPLARPMPYRPTSLPGLTPMPVAG